MAIRMEWAGDGRAQANAGAVPIGIVGIFLWIGVVSGTLYLLSQWQSAVLDARRAANGPGFWSEIRSPLQFWLIVGTIGAGIAAIVSSFSAHVRAASLILTLCMMAAAQMMLWQAYYGIARGEVAVHSALPWQEEARFRLADADIVARGCVRHSGRRTHNYAVFRVRYGVGGETIDLGSGLGPYNNKTWLAAMRPFTDGSLHVPEGERTERDPYCIASKSHGLDADDRARMRRLLG